MKKIFLFFVSLIFFALFTFKFYAQQDSEELKNTSQTSAAVVKIEQSPKKEPIFSFAKIKDIFSTERSKFSILILAFLMGLLTSFTPCIYPMIPLTIGIMQAQASTSIWRNFFLALSYVFGIATIYSIMGYVTATTTVIFGQWLSSPWVIALLILFFIYFAFSMFGFYELHLPAFLTRRANVSVKGSFLSSFLFGMISGTVASPCLTPALAIILSFIAKVGNPIFGFLTMWCFAFGMGFLLLLIGAFSTTLNLLPRSGIWMIEIQKFFGFVLLAMCIYLLQPFLAYPLILKMYAMLVFSSAIYYFSTAGGSKMKILIAGVLAVAAVSLLVFGLSKRAQRFAMNDNQDMLWTQNEPSRTGVKQLKTYKRLDARLFCLGRVKSSRLI